MRDLGISVPRYLATTLVVVAGALALTASCKPDGGLPDGLSQVEEGVGNLRFLDECRYASPTAAFGRVGLDKQVAMPFQSWMWRGSQMEADEQTAPPDTVGGVTIVQGYGPGEDIPNISLLPRSRLCAEYSATIHNTHQVLPGMKTWTRMQEVLLYARDPQELYTSLMNQDYGTFAPNVDPQSDLASTDDEWVNNFYGGSIASECGQHGDNLPDALGMPYPLEPSGQAQFTHPLAPEDFWESHPSASSGTQMICPSGPGTAPIPPLGSVKAAQVVQHGFCSQYVNVPQIDASTNAFQTITDSIFTSFVNSIQGYKDSCGHDQVGVDVCGFGVPRGCLLKSQEWAHVMPFIRQSDEVTSEQHGGFAFNGAYRLEDENGYYTDIGNGGVGDNYVKLNIAFEWDLTNEGGTILDTVDGRKQKKLDGRLTARAIQATSDHSGGGAVASQLEQSLVSGIEKQVGDAVYALTDQRFVFAGAPPFPFSCKPRQVRCDGSVANATVDFISNWETISPQQADGLPCGDFVTMLRDAVQTGGTIEGLSQDQINEVFEEMFSSHDNVFDYMRCASNPDPSTSKRVPYRCEYPFPMKRINVLPDQLEFVLLDDDDPTGGRELGNRAYGVYLATIGLSVGQPAIAANEQVPCQDPSVPAGSSFATPSVTIRRPFTYYVEGGKFVDRQSSALTCDGCKLLGSVEDFLNGFGALASYF